MHEYDQLEKELKKLRLKKFVMMGSTLLLVISAIFFISYLFGKNQFGKNQSQINPNQMVTKKTKKNYTISNEINDTRPSKSKEKNTLYKSIHIDKKIVYPDLNFTYELDSILHQAIIEQKNRGQGDNDRQYPKRTPVTGLHKTKPTVKIAAQSLSRSDIKKLEEQFYKTPRFGIAWILAQYYFRHKNFKKAAYWSLKANTLQKDNENTWILFAKSIYNLGRKKDAQRVLQHFLKHHPNAEKIKKYLEKIQ